MQGKVKWYNDEKGYGFIAPHAGGKDVFIHRSALQAAGIHELNEGQTIEFDEVMNKGKSCAGNVKVISYS